MLNQKKRKKEKKLLYVKKGKYTIDKGFQKTGKDECL